MSCFKESCPRLDCPLAEQSRPGPLSCCKVCKEPEPGHRQDEDLVPVDPNKMQDQAVARTGRDILEAGGCKLKGRYHENGADWHPNVLPWGEMKCITCYCKVKASWITYAQALESLDILFTSISFLFLKHLLFETGKVLGAE